MMEFLVHLDPDGWMVEQFLLDEDGKRVPSEDEPLTGVWE